MEPPVRRLECHGCLATSAALFRGAGIMKRFPVVKKSSRCYRRGSLQKCDVFMGNRDCDWPSEKITEAPCSLRPRKPCGRLFAVLRCHSRRPSLLLLLVGKLTGVAFCHVTHDRCRALRRLVRAAGNDRGLREARAPVICRPCARPPVLRPGTAHTFVRIVCSVRQRSRVTRQPAKAHRKTALGDVAPRTRLKRPPCHCPTSAPRPGKQ